MIELTKEQHQAVVDELRGMILEHLPMGEEATYQKVVDEIRDTVRMVENENMDKFKEIEECMLHLFYIEAILRVANEVVHVEFGLGKVDHTQTHSVIIRHLEKVLQNPYETILDKARPYLVKHEFKEDVQ